MTADRPALRRRQSDVLFHEISLPDRTDEVEIFDALAAKSTNGSIKLNGKHVAADGLVSRYGKRRILPAHARENDLDDDELEGMRTGATAFAAQRLSAKEL